MIMPKTHYARDKTFEEYTMNDKRCEAHNSQYGGTKSVSSMIKVAHIFSAKHQ